jgi:hypothetical protein
LRLSSVHLPYKQFQDDTVLTIGLKKPFFQPTAWPRLLSIDRGALFSETSGFEYGV